MRIALLNLMPKKIETETQFARLIGATPLQIELTLVRHDRTPVSKTTARPISARILRALPGDHATQKFDGLIITGAPIEHLPFEEVTYWDEMREIMDWTQTNVHSTFGVCWGGMAMLYHFHGIPKHMLDAQGVRLLPRSRTSRPTSPYLRGFSDDFVIPVSRWTEMRQDEIDAHPEPGAAARLAPRPAPAWSRTRATARSISSTISNTTATR